MAVSIEGNPAGNSNLWLWVVQRTPVTHAERMQELWQQQAVGCTHQLSAEEERKRLRGWKDGWVR